MKKSVVLRFGLLAGLVLGLTGIAPSPAHSAPSTTVADEAFAQKAAKGGTMEIILGTAARKSASDAKVKAFGRRMVDDHTKGNQKLEQTAKSLGIALDWEPDAKDKAIARRITSKHGSAFDRAYSSDMIDDHMKDIADYTKEAKYGKTPALKALAQQTLPTLKMHLQMARATHSHVLYAHRTK